MELAKHELCTGCGACAKICPKQAIVFEEDEKGFLYPRIETDKCIECGLCAKSCPAISLPETHPIQNAYAAQNLNRDELKDSTSGGLFTVFSKEIFRRNGVVYGCVWDEEYNAVTARAENLSEIIPMRGSKYVWSKAFDAFPLIRKDLNEGRTVLFTGLPCQTAGLKKYLQKEYENLYLMDCLCSGAPSPLALHKYLETIAPKEKWKDLNLKFRDKDPYGVGVHITWNGQKHKNKPVGENITNSYYYSFYIRAVDRDSCFHCPYGTGERISDLTMGDYWGISNYHQEFDIKAGVSALLVNTDKGAELLASVKDQLQISETKAESISAANNLNLGNKPHRKPQPWRGEFFKVLREQGWKAAEKKHLRTKGRAKLWVYAKFPAVLKLARKLKH